MYTVYAFLPNIDYYVSDSLYNGQVPFTFVKPKCSAYKMATHKMSRTMHIIEVLEAMNSASEPQMFEVYRLEPYGFVEAENGRFSPINNSAIGVGVCFETDAERDEFCSRLASKYSLTLDKN